MKTSKDMFPLCKTTRRVLTTASKNTLTMKTPTTQNFILIFGLFALFHGYTAALTCSNLTGYRGEAINFTRLLPPQHTTERIYFGIWENYYAEYVSISLLTILVHGNGTVTVHPNTIESEAKRYLGRVKWLGDIADKLVAFELSNIQDKDKETYGIEVQNKLTTSSNCTKLTVKPPSQFTYSPRSVSVVRGSSAEFSWKYFLNDDDRKLLDSIVFGVYEQGNFKKICEIQVSNGYVKVSTCLTTILVPTTNVTFIEQNIDLDDEAEYEIRLIGTMRSLRSKTKLIVNDPPKITTEPTSITINEYQTLNLTCQASGKPRPVMTWLRDGQTVQTSLSSIYIVRKTLRTNAGDYRCIAKNSVGEAKSGLVKIDVRYAPSINVSRKAELVHIPIGGSQWLKCSVNAKPKATIKWFSNGQLEQSDGENIKVKISNEADYKNYTCLATNSVGKDNATFILEQVGPPSTPIVSCDKREITSNSRYQMLHWNVPFDDGGAPVTGYTVKYRTVHGHVRRGPWLNVNVSKTETWHKLGLEWETEFELTVTAWNKYGESGLNLDRSSCVVKIGTDLSLLSSPTTAASTSPVIAAAAVNNKKQGLTTDIAIYIGPAVGLVILVIIVALLIKRRRSRRNRVKRSWTDHEQHVSFNTLQRMLEPQSTATDKLLESRGHQTMVGSPCYQMDPNWSIPRERICVLKVIGNGAFGLVYKGRVHGIGTDTVGWSLVAIKSPYADGTDSEVRDLMKEFELLKTLKPHPHVIKLIGCGEADGRPLVIIEYVPFGDLLGYLRKSRGENDDYYSDPEIKPNTNLSSHQLLRFAWNVADGMAYLASEKIIHRDLAARNVLVGEGLECKITDFGMAKDVSNDDIYVRTTEGRLPVKWTAIEALTGSGEYTTQSDVWSFGVVLYEICTIGSDPYPGIVGKEIPDMLERGYRMSRPKHVDAVVYDVMYRCWNKVPDNRPTFPELKETLMQLEDAQSKDYINLAECLYQNVQVNQPKGACAGDTILRKGSIKENDYHKGPHLSQSQAPAV